MSRGLGKGLRWAWPGAGTAAMLVLIAISHSACAPSVSPEPPTTAEHEPTRSPTPHVTVVATDTPTAPPAKRVVEAEWPERMEVDRSDYIRISLRKVEGTFVPTIEATGHTAVAGTIGPVGGTPEAPIEGAYGPGYEAYAIAELEGTAFEISLLGAEYQSLDQELITWDWNILSMKPGRQTISACVIVEWRPSDGKSEAIQRTVWRAPLTIVVEQPWIKTDQAIQLVLGSGFIGSVLCTPMVYQKARERGKRQRKVPYAVAVRRQLAEARENLGLIQERKSQYVMETDIPLQLVKEERQLLERIEELEQRVKELG